MTDHPIRLLGHRVVLRDFRLDDVDGAYAVIGDDRVTRSLSFDSRTRDQVAILIQTAISRSKETPRGEFYFAITLPEADELIGFARLGLSGVQAAKLGYAVHAAHWGHGYATDAIRILLDFGFHHLDLHRVSAAIGPDNVASITIANRLGFRYEGCIRDHVFTNNAWRDSLLYSILAGEWRDQASPA
jgi:ribosomal-protein-alanine N-acetyltransferase